MTDQNLQTIPLHELTLEQRKELACELLDEQVVEQRNKLHRWRNLTGQPAQIDTGYIGQHLVSIITGIRGGGFRGKGDDLEGGSEVKAANFLDSLDKKGAVAPRWNFLSNSEAEMESLLLIPAIYLVSIDTPPWAAGKTKLAAPDADLTLIEENADVIDAETAKATIADVKVDDLTRPFNVRFRVWKLVPSEHDVFKTRYELWMEQLGRPKLADPKRPAINFGSDQLAVDCRWMRRL